MLLHSRDGKTVAVKHLASRIFAHILFLWPWILRVCFLVIVGSELCAGCRDMWGLFIDRLECLLCSGVYSYSKGLGEWMA